MASWPPYFPTVTFTSAATKLVSSAGKALQVVHNINIQAIQTSNDTGRKIPSSTRCWTAGTARATTSFCSPTSLRKSWASYHVWETRLPLVSVSGQCWRTSRGINAQARFAVWQEVFDNGDQINQDTLVQVWKGWGRGWRYELADVSTFSRPTWRARMTIAVSLLQITRRGHYALLSAGWYLNDIKYGADWVRMYDQDPQDFGGTQEDRNRVLGGEVRSDRTCPPF